MSLVQDLNVHLVDLLPVHGVHVAIRGEPAPYRISERLHEAMQERAAKDGVPVSTLLRLLREELNGTDATGPSEFLQAMQALGIQIEGLAHLQEILAASGDWREEAAVLAKAGRKQGIRFFFAPANITTNEVTLRIVELADRFSFTPQQRRLLLQNINVASS